MMKFTFITTGIILLLFHSGTFAETENDTNRLVYLLELPLKDLFNVKITSVSYFEESNLDVGSSITVIPHEAWEARGARRTNDAYMVAPGMAALPNFLGQSSVFIRGYAQPDARGVQVLWDGVPISSYQLGTADVTRTNIQLTTLDTIEITRGPGSAFHGADAFHGVISLGIFDPDKDVRQFSFEKANNGYYSSSVKHSSKIGEGHRLNIAIGGNGQPDQHAKYQYTDSVTGLPASGEREYRYQSRTAFVKFKSNPDKKLSYNLGFYLDDNIQKGFHGLGLDTIANDVSDNKSLFRMSKANLKQKLDKDSSIELESYFWKQEHTFDRPTPTGGRTVQIRGGEYQTASTLVYRRENLPRATQFSVALSHRHEVNDLASRHMKNADGSTFSFTDLPFQSAQRRIGSFLVDAKTDVIDDKLTVRYGLRYDKYSDFGGQSTPRLGLIYFLTDKSVLKMLYGNAFRAPTTVEVKGTSAIVGNPDIQPEKIDTYELVYIKQAEHWKTEVILFTSRWRDSIAAIDPDQDDIEVFANSGKNKSAGLEVVHQHKHKQWLVEFSGSYVESSNQTEGFDYGAFPMTILNLGVGYGFSNTLSLFVNNRVHLNAEDGPDSVTTTPQSLKDYWRTDINIARTYRENWKYYINVLNLFDRKNFLPDMDNAEGGIPGEGRSIGAGFQLSL